MLALSFLFGPLCSLLLFFLLGPLCSLLLSFLLGPLCSLLLFFLFGELGSLLLFFLLGPEDGARADLAHKEQLLQELAKLTILKKKFLWRVVTKAYQPETCTAVLEVNEVAQAVITALRNCGTTQSSADKHLLGSSLRGRTDHSRDRECLLRILTHNLMILRRAAQGFQQSKLPTKKLPSISD
ncbi:MAG TPA: hypothetical protein VMX13_06920 [Sedimentisphaerales bacterium]|nr:hypothetical protein [Sedimentisphaerales bacterium]